MRSFDVTVDAEGVTAAQALDAFADPNYWRDRFVEFGAAMELRRCERKPDGTIDVYTVQTVGAEAMHPVLAKLYRHHIAVHTTETWRPDGEGAAGAIAVDVEGAPGSGGATAELTPEANGCSLRVAGDVRVRVPILGGPVERVVAGQFASHVPQMQEFTARWVRQHV